MSKLHIKGKRLAFWFFDIGKKDKDGKVQYATNIAVVLLKTGLGIQIYVVTSTTNVVVKFKPGMKKVFSVQSYY